MPQAVPCPPKAGHRGPARDAHASWPLSPLQSPGQVAAARTCHPHKGTLLRPAAQPRPAPLHAAPTGQLWVQAEHHAEQTLVGKVTRSAQEPEPPAGNGPQYLFTAQSNPPLKRQVSLAGVRQAQLSQHPNAPKPCVAPAQLHPGGSCSPRRMPVCMCVGGWVRVCVCVCMCG